MFRDRPTMKKTRVLNFTGGLAFVSFGTFMISAAQSFEDAGRVTPMFIGYGIIAPSILLLIVELFKSELIPATNKIEGSLARRGLFVTLMTLWVISLPYLGFVLAGCMAFGLISAAVPSKTDRVLTRFGVKIFAGIITTVGFWLVLTKFLRVPLPEAVIF